ncbi:nuclear transport factor 2 family protein [Nocardia aurea]|uniref:Nuclear transport factor 2 family protein n=1 Tax=Nocardia aurea TaxID=2144174 RepID=A0ABV3FTN6_9NOCA
MSEIEELRAAVTALTERVRRLEDHREITQLVAQYGPAVDSGSGAAAADLWTEDGLFAAVPQRMMRGREDIEAMVHGAGHQSLIHDGCGHVLTVPHVEIAGDRATGRSYALNIRFDAETGRFWVARVSANTWTWVRTPEGWRISERVNANLDGSDGPRDMLAPTHS